MSSVIKVLNQIENKELVLPEFQREFTWNKDQAKKLIASDQRQPLFRTALPQAEMLPNKICSVYAYRSNIGR